MIIIINHPRKSRNGRNASYQFGCAHVPHDNAEARFHIITIMAREKMHLYHL